MKRINTWRLSIRRGGQNAWGLPGEASGKNGLTPPSAKGSVPSMNAEAHRSRNRYPTEILDEAFKLVLEASRRTPAELPARELQRLFPELRPAQVEEIVGRAHELEASAYDAAERIRSGRMDETRSVAELQSQCPGFGSGSYGAALGWGYYLSR
jgi:hypothetical protein